MSDNTEELKYFCILCDLSKIQKFKTRRTAKLHILEHFNDPKDDGVNEIIDSLIKYEEKLFDSMKMQPKELPKNANDNDCISKDCYEGCPMCVYIIRVYNIDTVIHDDRAFHVKNLTELKGRLSKRRHCHYHLHYRPFRCIFPVDDNTMKSNKNRCSKRFTTQYDVIKHIQISHKLQCDDYDQLTYYYNNEHIEEIEALFERQFPLKPEVIPKKRKRKNENTNHGSIHVTPVKRVQHNGQSSKDNGINERSEISETPVKLNLKQSSLLSYMSPQKTPLVKRRVTFAESTAANPIAESEFQSLAIPNQTSDILKSTVTFQRGNESPKKIPLDVKEVRVKKEIVNDKPIVGEEIRTIIIEQIIKQEMMSDDSDDSDDSMDFLLSDAMERYDNDLNGNDDASHSGPSDATTENQPSDATIDRPLNESTDNRSDIFDNRSYKCPKTRSKSSVEINSGDNDRDDINDMNSNVNDSSREQQIDDTDPNCIKIDQLCSVLMCGASTAKELLELCDNDIEQAMNYYFTAPNENVSTSGVKDTDVLKEPLLDDAECSSNMNNSTTVIQKVDDDEEINKFTGNLFCVFCDEQIEAKYAKYHYGEHIDVYLECAECGDRFVSSDDYTDIEAFRLHSEHARDQKKGQKLLLNLPYVKFAKNWIKEFLNFQCSSAIEQMYRKKYEYCHICKTLEVNRSNIAPHDEDYIGLKEHLRRHFLYSPVYECSACEYNCKSGEENDAKMHLKTHGIDVENLDFDDCDYQFTRKISIPKVEEIINKCLEISKSIKDIHSAYIQ